MQAERILIITKNWLGDVIFEEPFIRALKRRFQGASITCLTNYRCHDILIANPNVDRVICFDDRKKDKSLFSRFKLLLSLRKEKFSYVFILHRSLSRALLMRLAGIPERIGYATKARGFLLTQAVAEPTERIHRVDYFLALLEKSNLYHDSDDARDYVFYTTSEDEAAVEELMAHHGLNEKKFVIVHTGANWEKKRWPVSHWIRLVHFLAERSDYTIVCTGSEIDKERIAFIEEKTNVNNLVSLAGKTTIRELGALCRRAALMISADSGPMHIASGVGTPVVALFGPTDSFVTGPRGQGATHILQHSPHECSIPCYDHSCERIACMQELKPEEVLECIKKNRLLPI